jgi:hypothetical protein
MARIGVWEGPDSLLPANAKEFYKKNKNPTNKV